MTPIAHPEGRPQLPALSVDEMHGGAYEALADLDTGLAHHAKVDVCKRGVRTRDTQQGIIMLAESPK